MTTIVSKPEAWPFCHPVSQHAVKDYYDIVKNPMTFEQIREVIILI